jgi:peptidoglycan glycosyltransferase
VVRRYQPEPWTTATSPQAAGTMRQAMIGVVADGTATGLQIPGQEVGGKTGTAQLGTDPPRSHAWIIGFAGPPGGAPEVAVAVIVEGQPGASEQTGGRVAAPIARAVMERILLVNRGQAPGGGG